MGALQADRGVDHVMIDEAEGHQPEAVDIVPTSFEFPSGAGARDGALRRCLRSVTKSSRSSLQAQYPNQFDVRWRASRKV